MDKFVKAARHILRQRMTKQATSGAEDVASGWVFPFTSDYDPYIGAVNQLKGEDFKNPGITPTFAPYKQNTTPLDYKDIRKPYTRTLYDLKPNTPRAQYPYKTGLNMPGHFWLNPNHLHEALFGLPANTKGMYHTDQRNTLKNLDILDDNRWRYDNLQQFKRDIMHDYKDAFEDDLIKQSPRTRLNVSDARRLLGIEDTGSIYPDWEENDVFVGGTADGDYHMKLDAEERERALNRIQEAQSWWPYYNQLYTAPREQYVDNNERIAVENKEKQLLNRRLNSLRGEEPDENYINQKMRLMQKNLDRSQVAKRFAKNPSLLNTVAYYGSKMLPYLWPSNWQPKNQKAFNTIVSSPGFHQLMWNAGMQDYNARPQDHRPGINLPSSVPEGPSWSPREEDPVAPPGVWPHDWNPSHPLWPQGFHWTGDDPVEGPAG